ncbi:GlcG/HbpS family heme-binding protein [Rosenbergiella epipactidis]|uniref:GlcG/HbpS family heme-binding protein n=1 Tax=Rosenbergiella epipactidis TaxID=1544694 RepID=UPI001F4E8BF2|nr:heme-binding protein [Rosenbergiella epipactidis]
MSPRKKIVNSRHYITAEAAESAGKIALQLAEEIGLMISVAVVDNSGHLLHFTRHDTAQFLTIDIAINKAWTASSFSLSSQTWNDAVQQPSLTPLTQTPRFTPVAGGYPLFHHGELIGAIGISGGSTLQDHSVAERTAQTLGFHQST